MEQKYYLCIEYRTDQYGKHYFSIDQDGLLNYDTLYSYTLEELDQILEKYTEEQILNQMKEDNVLYFLGNNVLLENIHLSIRYQENGKERSIDVLPQNCLQFDMHSFLQTDLTDIDRKLIYNNLGGYLDNPHISMEMKKWIKSLRTLEKEELAKEYISLSYLDQRKIKQVIHGILTLSEEKKMEKSFTRKKISNETKNAA